MSGLISKSGNSLNYDNNIHGFLKFLRDFDPYLEERPVLFNLRARKFIFPFERSQPEDPIPVWWKTYTDLKHNELVAFKKGNFENALTSVAAVAILSGYIQPRGGAVIFANTGIIDVNMEKLFV